MEMDSHGGQSGAHTKKKHYPTTSWHGPLSARNEHQSHPLAGEAQACGRLIRRISSDGGCLAYGLQFSRVISISRRDVIASGAFEETIVATHMPVLPFSAPWFNQTVCHQVILGLEVASESSLIERLKSDESAVEPVVK